ncbi:hypothetical protein D3C87_593420 [compost metagenome]
MEKYTVIISLEIQYHFQVGQYPRYPSGGCKYKIYHREAFVARLEPNGQYFSHVHQNPGDIDLEILHLLAEQIELRRPRASKLGELENIEFDVNKFNLLHVVTELG